MSTYSANIIKTLTSRTKNGKNITRYIDVLSDLKVMNQIENGEHLNNLSAVVSTANNDKFKRILKEQHGTLDLLLKNLYTRLRLRYGIFAQCDEFTNTMFSKTNKEKDISINRALVNNLVKEELGELDEAKSETEEVDAVHDAIYCLAQQLSQAGYTPEVSYKIFDIIHHANMTKFGKGGKMRTDGKWIKPANFVSPDAEIEKTINNYNNTPERKYKIHIAKTPKIIRILKNPNKITK